MKRLHYWAAAIGLALTLLAPASGLRAQEENKKPKPNAAEQKKDDGVKAAAKREGAQDKRLQELRKALAELSAKRAELLKGGDQAKPELERLKAKADVLRTQAEQLKQSAKKASDAGKAALAKKPQVSAKDAEAKAKVAKAKAAKASQASAQSKRPAKQDVQKMRRDHDIVVERHRVAGDGHGKIVLELQSKGPGGHKPIVVEGRKIIADHAAHPEQARVRTRDPMAHGRPSAEGGAMNRQRMQSDEQPHRVPRPAAGQGPPPRNFGGPDHMSRGPVQAGPARRPGPMSPGEGGLGPVEVQRRLHAMEDRLSHIEHKLDEILNQLTRRGPGGDLRPIAREGAPRQPRPEGRGPEARRRMEAPDAPPPPREPGARGRGGPPDGNDRPRPPRGPEGGRGDGPPEGRGPGRPPQGDELPPPPRRPDREE